MPRLKSSLSVTSIGDDQSRLAGFCLGKNEGIDLSDRYCYLPSHTLSHHSLPLVYFHFFSTQVPIPIYAVIGTGDYVHLA